MEENDKTLVDKTNYFNAVLFNGIRERNPLDL